MREDRYRVQSDVRFRVVDGDAVVLRQNSGQVLVLNAVGARILELLTAQTSTDDLIATLLDELEVDRPQLERDFDHFLDELLNRDIVEPLPIG
ncbi:MAG: PqqD family protein [Acidobacteriota bacterium]